MQLSDYHRMEMERQRLMGQVNSQQAMIPWGFVNSGCTPAQNNIQPEPSTVLLLVEDDDAA